MIGLIKNSKIPIICMCNDRNHQKIRSLANYCFDLRFQRPRVEQIKVLHICPVYGFQYRWCLSRCANTNRSFAWRTCVFFNARAWRFSALSSCTEVSPDCQNLLRRLTVDDNIRKLFTILHRGTLFWNCSAVFCRLVSLCQSLLLRTFFSVRFIFNTLSCHCPFAC